MATIRTYRKPENFRLPIRYTRREMDGSQTNSSFCRRLRTESSDYDKYEIVIHYTTTREIQVPGEEGPEIQQVSDPQSSKYYVYISDDEDVMYCIGSDIDFLEPELIEHSNVSVLNVEPFDLVRLRCAIESGRIGLIGQSCIINDGTCRVGRRKLNGVPFAQNDASLERGRGVESDCLEVQIPVDGIGKSFYIYSDGTITTRGRPTSGTDSFSMLKCANDFVRRVVR